MDKLYPLQSELILSKSAWQLRLPSLHKVRLTDWKTCKFVLQSVGIALESPQEGPSLS